MADLDIKEALDKVFWDLSEGTVVYRILDILQKGVYTPVYDDTSRLYKMWFPHKADDLTVFASILNVANRTSVFSNLFKDFEVYRMKVLGLWLASVHAPTLRGLNYIGGAFTAQPVFIERIEDVFESAWWLGVYEGNTPKGSFLGGTVAGTEPWYLDPIYAEPRTWLRSVFDVSTGFFVEVFGDKTGGDLIWNDEEKREFEYWIRQFLPPVKIYIKYFESREPMLPNRYYLWGLDYGGVFILQNMEKVAGIFYVLTDDAVNEGNASLETEFRVVENGIYVFSIFDFILSDVMERHIFYDTGSGWVEVGPFGMVIVSTGQVRFKVEVSKISNIENYRFISMMIKKKG
jgi:hypothetical protein